jgi:hypothetical protein
MTGGLSPHQAQEHKQCLGIKHVFVDAGYHLVKPEGCNYGLLLCEVGGSDVLIGYCCCRVTCCRRNGGFRS